MTLDEDVAAKARRGAAELGKPFKEVVNMALRAGLDSVLSPPTSRPYQTTPRALGLAPGLTYDSVSDLLAVAEGDDHV